MRAVNSCFLRACENEAFLMENVSNLERQHGDVLEQWESIVRRGGYVAGQRVSTHESLWVPTVSVVAFWHYWHLR